LERFRWIYDVNITPTDILSKNGNRLKGFEAAAADGLENAAWTPRTITESGSGVRMGVVMKYQLVEKSHGRPTNNERTTMFAGICASVSGAFIPIFPD